MNLGQRRQNYGLRLRPHLAYVYILFPGGSRPRRQAAVGGSRHLKNSGQPLERVLSDGQCPFVCPFCLVAGRELPY